MTRYLGKMLKFISLSLIFANSSFAKDRTEENFFLVQGIKKLNKLESERALSPWLIEEENKLKLAHKDEGEALIVHSGCKFYEVTYFAEDLAGKPLELLVRFQPGEFCDVSDYMFAFPTLIKVKYWEGKKYLEAFARVRFDGEDSMFIVGDEIVHELGVESLYVPLSNIQGACEDSKYLSEVEISWMLDDPTVFRPSDKSVCYNKGVYINSLK